MCLLRVFTDAETEEWLADKPEVIEVWKAVVKVPERKAYEPVYAHNNHIYNSAISYADRQLIKSGDVRYWSGYHFFLNENEAREYASVQFGIGATDNVIAVKCIVRKEWITSVGIEGRVLFDKKGHIHFPVVIVVSQAVFPHYPETEARLEDMPQETELVLSGAPKER